MNESECRLLGFVVVCWSVGVLMMMLMMCVVEEELVIVEMTTIGAWRHNYLLVDALVKVVVV